VFKDKSARGTPRDACKINENIPDSTGCLRLELPSLWTINYDRIPGLLNTILITVTLPSYKKNVRVLSRRLSRAPSKLRAVIYNNDSANGKQITKITI